MESAGAPVFPVRPGAAVRSGVLIAALLSAGCVTPGSATRPAPAEPVAGSPNVGPPPATASVPSVAEPAPDARPSPTRTPPRAAKSLPPGHRRPSPEVERALTEGITPPHIPAPRLPATGPEAKPDDAEPRVVVTPLAPKKNPEPRAEASRPPWPGIADPAKREGAAAGPGRDVPFREPDGESPHLARTGSTDLPSGVTPAVGPAAAPPQPVPFETFMGQQTAALQKNPADLRSRERLAVLRTLDRDFLAAEELMQGLGGSDNEYVSVTRAYLYRWLGDNAAALRSLNDIGERWAAACGFQVAYPVLCDRQILGFREYQPAAEGRPLKSGTEIWLYSEVLHPTLEPQRDGTRRLRLYYTWTLEDDAGRAVAVPEWSRPDLLRDDVRELKGAVHEIWTPLSLRVPGVPAAGRYRIRLRVEDRPTGRWGEVLFPLEISR